MGLTTGSRVYGPSEPSCRSNGNERCRYSDYGSLEHDDSIRHGRPLDRHNANRSLPPLVASCAVSRTLQGCCMGLKSFGRFDRWMCSTSERHGAILDGRLTEKPSSLVLAHPHLPVASHPYRRAQYLVSMPNFALDSRALSSHVLVPHVGGHGDPQSRAL